MLLEDFIKLLQKNQGKIKCGFAGAPLICQTLAEYGQTDIAYQLLFQEDYPSWLYAVNMGATTIWERWNSILPDGSISGTGMNSLNHYSYGSVIEFLYAYTAGLRPAEAGFSKAIIEPNLHGKLRTCECTFYSKSGKYVVEWNIIDTKKIKVHIEIPFGCTAEVNLPADGKAAFRLSAGIYDYEYESLINFSQRFHGNTKLSEVFSNPKASEILLRLIPASTMLKGIGGVTIDQLKMMTMLGITDEMVGQLLKELDIFRYF